MTGPPSSSGTEEPRSSTVWHERTGFDRCPYHLAMTFSYFEAMDTATKRMIQSRKGNHSPFVRFQPVKQSKNFAAASADA